MNASNETVVKSTCRMCHGVCGVLVHIKDGKVLRITGDKDSPASEGFTCAKGRASVELLYHPNRLKYPLQRVGEKGEGKWQRISWDEALDKIAQTFMKIQKEYGGPSLVFARGTGRLYGIWNKRFAQCLGTPNVIGPVHVCYLPRLIAALRTCGQLPICDFYGFGGVYPACILVWGCNLPEAGAIDGMCAHQLNKSINRGAKLIVVDPRRITLAQKADHWAQIRPGTDDALALGLIHVIIKEGLYDKEFVDRWTIGFNALAKRIEDYPPARVAQITWVPVETIVAMARLYATTKPACLLWGVAVDQNTNNFQTSRALMILRGITGNIDVPGGDVFWVPPAGIVQTSPIAGQQLPPVEPMAPEIEAQKIQADIFRLLPDAHQPSMWEHILNEKPYPIKAMYLMGNNLLVAGSNSLKIAAALKKLEFIAAADFFMTPTMEWADIVLPAATWLEINDVAEMHMIWCNPVRQKVVQIGECWDDKKIMAEITRRMGREDFFPWEDDETYCNWVLKDTGITFAEMKKAGFIKGHMRYRKYEQEGFQTPSGKFEIYAATLEELGYDPLPYYVEPPRSPYATPQLAKEYPLILTTGARVEEYFHSEGRQLPSLRKRHPDPVFEIHPQTAQDLGIAEGEWAWIETTGGKIKQRAHLTKGIHPKVVSVQHSWWFPEKSPPDYGWQESSANLLFVDTEYDPHTGGEALKSYLCKVYKMELSTPHI